MAYERFHTIVGSCKPARFRPIETRLRSANVLAVRQQHFTETRAGKIAMACHAERDDRARLQIAWRARRNGGGSGRSDGRRRR